MAVVDGVTLGLESEVAATGEQITNHVPDDLVFFILSKLPLKSLKRFRCVCKSWALLFENPNFINIFRHNFISNHRSYNEDSSLLLFRVSPDIYHESTSSLFSLSGESFQNRVKLDWPSPYKEGDHYFSILGSTSINGILCLFHEYQSVESGVLWNLTTQESKVIPLSQVEFVPFDQYISIRLCGFGYDRVRDDYKVIRYVRFFEDTNYPNGPPIRDPLWEMYSLRSNSWRKLDIGPLDIPSSDFSFNRLYLDGMCHWTGFTVNYEYADVGGMLIKAYLVSFDLRNEVFLKTLIPLDRPSYECFVVLNESIAVITNPIDTSNFYISILGEIGVSESWTKLFILELLPCVHRAIGIGKKGDIFFSKYDDELVRFDLSTNMIEELSTKGDKYWCRTVLYKQSFLPIGEINN